MKQSKLLFLNTVTSILFLVVSIFCGFIVPYLTLNYFGSEINGLVDSINQFLKLIIFLEFGVGAVIQTSLYSPLTEGNLFEINRIIILAERFFKKIALILLLYVILIIIIYPNIVISSSVSMTSIRILIFVMSLNLFSQYYFGIVDKLLLLADQRGYIVYLVQTFSMLLGTALSSLFIMMGYSIVITQLITAVFFILRPVIFRIYITKNYQINRALTIEKGDLNDKWSGLSQHIASVILDTTDVVILTIFTTLQTVSVYSIYFLVVTGVRQLIKSLTSGVQSFIGKLYASNEMAKLVSLFRYSEWLIHSVSIIIWSIVIKLLVPFVLIYTNNIADVSYNVPIFSTLLSLAYLTEALNLVYLLFIISSGHFKETQTRFSITALINVTLSIVLVNRYHLIGVSVATLVSLLYHLIWMMVFVNQQILKISLVGSIKQLFFDILSICIIVISLRYVPINPRNLGELFISGLLIAIIVIIESFVLNFVFYRRHFWGLFRLWKHKE